MPSAADFEKLGVFYLGRPYDWQQKKAQDGVLLYDSKDLVTHAVCVGMTGSGKTGLCLALIEEAAIDGIPAIVIDPKGDLANLLLTFPALRPEDFRPWINEDDARRKNLSPDDYARQQAELWQKGLASWGEDGARIQRLRDAADFAIYTPGSNAGIPLSILKSFAAPPAAIRDDEELLRERIGTTATSLLGLLGIDADPIKSREHILIATILDAAWRQGQELDLAGLIQQIQTPPVKRVGVLDLEAFFPSKDRFALAMSLNNLLAAPGFGAWMEGEPLDVDALLHTPEGKPRVAIVSIAHLNDAERMFFVSLLLNQVVGWMRTQSGTTSLRALLYMDEIFGFFPPVANPPSKTPLLTLLKQARAFGVGVVLATQNPVDLDYKGLSNTGTWFIGRLQTERDKARVLDGLEGAAGTAGQGFDRAALERILSGLSSRVFLMNNVHEDHPVVFESRWVMSYLRGPLTRGQIKSLMDARRGAPAAGGSRSGDSAAPTARPAAATGGKAARAAARRPGRSRPGDRGGRRRPAPAPPARRPAALRPRARRRARRLHALLPADARGRGPGTGHRRQERRRREPRPGLPDRDHRRRGAGGVGPGLRGGLRHVGPGPGPRRPGGLRRPARRRGQEEELRRLEPGLRGLAAPVADGRAAAQPVAEGRLEAGRIGARLPRAPAGVDPAGARPRERGPAPEVRAQGRRAPGAPPARRAGGGARERAGQAAGHPDRDLGRAPPSWAPSSAASRSPSPPSAGPPPPPAVPGACSRRPRTWGARRRRWPRSTRPSPRSTPSSRPRPTRPARAPIR